MAPDLEARRPLAKRSSGDWNSSAGKVEGQLPLLIRKVGRRSTHAAFYVVTTSGHSSSSGRPSVLSAS